VHYYNFFISPDGTFRMDDVVPGSLSLHVSATERNVNGNWGEQVAMAQSAVTIPEIPGGRTDEPFDVGTLTLTAIKRIKLGDDMSTFTMPTVEGKAFNMADYKGKVVLLHTWASANEASGEEAIALKEIYDAFGKNEKFVMIGICFDPSAATGKSFLQKNAISWPQVYVGEKSSMYQELGLQMFPTTLIIGADGKLVAKDVARPQLNQLLGAKLKN
jgi:peroxiredoxin